jgi:hypothetical protein
MRAGAIGSRTRVAQKVAYFNFQFNVDPDLKYGFGRTSFDCDAAVPAGGEYGYLG